MALPYEISDMCKKCISSHIAKKGEFKVSCKPVPKSLEDPDNPYYPFEKVMGIEEYNMLEAEDKINMQLKVNKLLWAKEYLNWSVYNSERNFDQFYQREMLNCNAKLRTMRLGRRMGKCNSFDSIIITANRGPITFEELNKEDSIITFDVKTGKLIETKEFEKKENGYKDTIELTLRSGKQDIVTLNHPYLVFSNGKLDWKESGDLKIGDRIAIPKSYDKTFEKYESQENNRSLYRILGYLISDGGTNYKNHVRFTNFDEKLVEDINMCLDEYGCILNEYTTGNFSIVNKVKSNVNKINRIIKENKMNCLAIDKKIPEIIYTSSIYNIKEFISAMWDCDGWVDNQGVGYCSSSKDLIIGLKHLLLRIGIQSTYKKKKVKYKDGYKYAYQLLISNYNNLVKFDNAINLVQKGEKLKKLISSYKNGATELTSTLPIEIVEYIKKQIKIKNLSESKMGIRLRNEYSPSIDKVKKINEYLKDDEIKFILESDLLFDEIKEIKKTGVKKTYSISVPSSRTFITNDIITHNTEVVTVDALHFAQTNPGKTIMIIGPFQNLIDEIFDRIAALLDSDESAFTGGYERKRQPNVVRLPNGSQIKGFTTGLNGDSIRGQSADRIYFDEAAYIPPTAFRSVLALLMDNPSVSITATSTPSALQTNFKKWCLEDPDWKEFHFQSTLFPYFHEIEGTLKATYTGDDFALEVLAEFIEGSSRIFKSHNVATAAKEYDYVTRFDQMIGENRKDWIITIGVDYNEYKNGVQLVVLGFNKNTQHFKVLNRVSLHNETYGEDVTKNLQTTGVNLIKDQYQSFEADFVYVDQGHGSMQNEVLAKWFFDIGKPHVFKGIDFASNYEYEDIYTGEIKHKRKKVMMVYFLQKRFELGEITYSVNEEKEKGLMTDQLNDYRVDRYDSKDQPIFAGHDHILDGLMLANFAIIENFHALFDIKTGLYVGTIERTKESFVETEFKGIKYEKPNKPWEFDAAAITDDSGTFTIKRGKKRKRGLTDEFGIF